MNEREIKSLKWNGKDKRISLGQSLYLLLRKSSKTYLIRKQSQGKTQIITLGKGDSAAQFIARFEFSQGLLRTPMWKLTCGVSVY